MFLSGFQSHRPTYKVPQEFSLQWLAQAHGRLSETVDSSRFAKLLNRYGCGPDKIESRGSFLRDFSHESWEEMQIFMPGRGPVSIDERLAFFDEILARPVAELYPVGSAADFESFIHVTCTGYSSPSLVQARVSELGWGGQVECLHAYHMGCYASLPAIRMAKGSRSTEILHTELCTLHFDPSNHEPEQLVIQSLFADGVIRYRVSQDKPADGFEVVCLKEIIAPSTLQDMTWAVSAQGFRMTLSREVPKAVQGAIGDLVKPWRSPDAVYAIHPGGPRIIDAVKEALALSEDQVYFSRQILKNHGNMSSATLPHVWQMMLPELKPGTPVISMAFGPGLTLSSSLMRKT